MRPIETMRWAGPLLPVGWEPATMQPGEPLPAREETLQREQPPALRPLVDQTMKWAGPLPPGMLE